MNSIAVKTNPEYVSALKKVVRDLGIEFRADDYFDGHGIPRRDQIDALMDRHQRRTYALIEHAKSLCEYAARRRADEAAPRGGG